MADRRLTGYHVSHIDKVSGTTTIEETQPIHPAHGQDVFASDDWNSGVKPHGLTLEKVGPDCQDLMMWENGKTAIGMRRLGKGCIIEVGVKFQAERTADRKPRHSRRRRCGRGFTRSCSTTSRWRIPATLSKQDSPVLWRHYVSNNGVYDVWTLWNRSRVKADTVTLQMAKGLEPATCVEIKNEPVSFPITKTDAGAAMANVALAPEETRIFISHTRK